MLETIMSIVKQFNIEQDYGIAVQHNAPVVSIGDDVTIVNDEARYHVINHLSRIAQSSNEPKIALAIAIASMMSLRVQKGSKTALR